MKSYFRSLNIKLGNFFFQFRNGLFPIVVILLMGLTRPHMTLNEGKVFKWLIPSIGVILCLMGEGIRLLTIGFKYIDRGGRNNHLFASRLVTDGIYKHVRNPMYLGNLLIVFGFSFYTGSPMFFVIAVSFFIISYQSIMAAEKDYLMRQFGEEYSSYCQTVNSLWPSFRGLSKTLSTITFSWKRCLRKDYGTITTLALILISLSLWKTYFLHKSMTIKIIPGTVIEILIATILYIGVRKLKKTGRLADA